MSAPEDRPVLPSFPQSGGCSCGAVQFEISEPPLAIYACHCTDCQRRSGSAFALNMPVRSKAFTVTRGSPKAWVSTSVDGVVTSSWFCPDCSARIYGEREGRPSVVVVRAGALDDTRWIRPVAHLYWRSAQPWETVRDQGACYETMPDDFGQVMTAWRALYAD